MTASVPLGGSAWAGATGVLDGNVSERATRARRLRDGATATAILDS